MKEFLIVSNKVSHSFNQRDNFHMNPRKSWCDEKGYLLNTVRKLNVVRLFEDVQFYISIPPETVKKLKVFWRFRGHRNGTLDMFWTPYIRSVHQLCPWELIIWVASFYEYSFNAPVSSHISSGKWKLSLDIAAKNLWIVGDVTVK